MIEKNTFGRIDRYILQNLLVNMYSKMGGRPWSLHSPLGDVNAFIGIGFGLNPKETEKHVYIGVANVFDSHGEWVDICSDHKDITNEERESFYGHEAFTERSSSYKLSEEMTQNITEESLKRFRDVNPSIGFPRNVVIHKNGRLYECEIRGIMAALKKLEESGAAFEKIGLLSIIQIHNYRLFGNEDSFERGLRVIKDRPPKRGAVYFLDAEEALLCTTGKFYGERPGGKKLIYTGLGTPRPLLLKNHTADPKDYGFSELQPYPFNDLIKQVFGLSKIHWGSLRTDIHLPVTSLYSNRVAKVISKSGIERIHKPASKRPWFL
jgi:argonaute-like protein implicated in RNA metabolism and viral defense